MVSRRFAQRGHASLTTELLGPGPDNAQRVTPRNRTLVVATAVALASLLAFSLNKRQATEGKAITEPVSEASAVSLINSALTLAQDAVQGKASHTPSGLKPVSLTGEQLQHVKPMMGRAEARLIEIYQLIGNAQHREALKQAESLVRDHPNFQLAHLVYGDLLSQQTRPVRRLGDVPDTHGHGCVDHSSPHCGRSRAAGCWR